MSVIGNYNVQQYILFCKQVSDLSGASTASTKSVPTDDTALQRLSCDQVYSFFASCNL